MQRAASSLPEAMPRAAMLSALLPGLFEAPVRTKVYTSNVMDEERTRRITDHFAYMKAKKVYRAQLHSLLMRWRAEIKGKELEAQAQQRQARAEEARAEAARVAELLKERRLSSLEEQLRQAELEHKLAQVQLQRAVRRQEELQRREAARAERYQQLLEASRHWIRQQDFESAILHALDNPQPFGVAADLPLQKAL